MVVVSISQLTLLCRNGFISLLQVNCGVWHRPAINCKTFLSSLPRIVSSNSPLFPLFCRSLAAVAVHGPGQRRERAGAKVEGQQGGAGAAYALMGGPRAALQRRHGLAHAHSHAARPQGKYRVLWVGCRVPLSTLSSLFKTSSSRVFSFSPFSFPHH